jgi:hypothetical protein
MSFEAPMSFERILCFQAENQCYATGIPCFPRNREFAPNILIFHAIKPRRHPEKGKFGPILKIPC